MDRAQTADVVVPGVDLIEEIGSGASTVVYRAVRAGRGYAVKLLRSAGDARDAAAFRREATLLACLEHPGLIRIHEVGEAAGGPYLIMELVEGRTLGRVLRDLPDARMDEDRAARIASEVADALTVAHRAGLVHRDIKPDNIMITSDGGVRLIDFGLAARAGGDQSGDTAVGTFRYSAPEQTGMLHRPVDGRSDLYGLGVVLFECLAGRPPFAADDVGELIRLHLSAVPPDLRGLRPQLAPALADVVARLLAKDPDDRYQSAPGLRADLARILAGERGPFPLGWAGAPGGIETGLVGRAEPARRLLARWRRTTDRSGGVVLLEGPPGAGKSRLVRELTAAVRAEGRLVLHGKSAADDAVPLAPLRGLVDRYVADVTRLAPAELDETVDGLREIAGLTAPALSALSPTLGTLLGGGGGAGGAVGAPDTDERQFADAVAGFLAGIATLSGGAVLHLDDVQWWDAGTRRVLRRLRPHLARTPLLVVLTARDDAPGLDAIDVDLRLHLPPLDGAGVAALVAGHFGGGPVPPELVARVTALSSGNPLAAHEYVRVVVDAGLVRPSWGSWVLDAAGLDALSLPENVGELVVRRVDGLGGPSRALLTVAAAVGNRFAPEVVAEVAGVADAEAVGLLAEAAGHQLVEALPGGHHTFLHDRIREALLAHLDQPALRALHQRIAATLERRGGNDPAHVYALARHYLAGEPDRTPAAAFVAVAAAGVLALDEHATAESVEFLSRAAGIAAAGGITTTAAFHATLGAAAIRTGAYGLGDDHLHRALATEVDPLRRARAYLLLAQSQHLRWAGDRAFEMIRHGLAELGRPLPRHPLALAGTTLARFLFGVAVGKLPDRLRLVRGPLIERYELRAELLNAGAQAAAIADRQPLMTAVSLIGLPLANRLGPGKAYADTQAALAVIAMVLGRRAQAHRMMALAGEVAAVVGDPRLVAHIEWMRGVIADTAPPLHAGTGSTMIPVLEAHRGALDSGDYLNGYGAMGQVQILRGYRADVAEWYRRGLAAVESPQESLGNIFSSIGAQAAALGGEHARAAALLREVRDFVATLPEESRGQLINLAIAEVQLAVEQGEIGAELDRVLDDVAALRINPAFVLSYQRPLWIYQAFGRLAQLAAAPPDRRAERLAQTHAALRALRKVANSPLLRVFHATATASLAQLTGRHREALDRLAATETRAGGLNIPLLHYEIARVRARAWRALHCPEDAHRAAIAALTLAVRHGWQTRARWIRTEFDLDEPIDATGSSMRRTEHTGVAGDLHQRRRLEALHQVSLAASTVLDPEELARVALDEIVRIFGAERAFLFLVDVDTDELVPYVGRDSERAEIPEPTGYGSTLVERVRADHRPLVVTGTEEGAALGSQSAKLHGLRSIMVAPLQIKGRLQGVVYLDSRAARGIFTADDIDILGAITNHVATALETARAAQLELAVHAAVRERDTAESLRAAMAELTANLEPAQVQATLAERVRAALPGSTVHVLRSDADGHFVGGALDGAPVHAALTGELSGELSGELAAALSAGETVRAPGRPPAALAPLLPPDCADWVAVPLRVREEDRGLLLAGGTGRRFTAAEVEVAAALAGQGAAALDNAMLFQTVRDLAIRDALTGLYNRRHFFEIGEQRAKTALRYKRPITVVMIDIDHFKSINDTHGHPVGDEVIREVAQRLARTMRETDIICRYGGEEFALVLAETSEDGALGAANRLHGAVIEGPVVTAAGDLRVTVSVGLAGPTDSGGDLVAMLSRADEALYEAKRNGRNQVAAA